jgi:hypothetical protein
MGGRREVERRLVCVFVCGKNTCAVKRFRNEGLRERERERTSERGASSAVREVGWEEGRYGLVLAFFLSPSTPSSSIPPNGR